MKHIYIALFLLTSATLTQAAFIDISEKQHTVSELATLKSGEEVALKGQIQKHLRKDDYEFSDSTGKIIVEIKDNRWGDLDITQDDTIRITGKIDRDYQGITVKVNYIDLVK